MLVVMEHGATPEQVAGVVRLIEELGYQARPMPGSQRTAIGLVGNDGRVEGSRFETLPGVAQVIHVTKPYKQASREWRPENTIVTIAPGVHVGGDDITLIAGPCSVESEEQIVAAARAVRAAGASCLRGGAFKPRSSPYSFQGLGKRGLEMLALAKRETGLAIVTEAMDDEGAELVAEYADCIQIGARNMQNYSLLRTVGRLGRPVLLKRGLAATITDLLLSAEYILSRRKRAGHPLRARRAQLRYRRAEHARPDRDSHRAQAVAPADSRRSQPRNGTSGQGHSDGARRGRRGRGWHPRRGAPEPRARAVRRSAIALPGAVRAAGGGASRDRDRHWPHRNASARNLCSRSGVELQRGMRQRRSCDVGPLPRSSFTFRETFIR